MPYVVIIACLLAILAAGVGWHLGRRRPAGNQEIGGELNQALKDNRRELSESLKNTTDSIDKRLTNLQTVLSKNLEALRQDNHQQLERMRQTVDEKLQSTLEKRLTESFKRVDQQLEAVNKNMGEMQNLASDVGELQKTLSGVKTRGVWGEAHLSNLLSETLNPEQYETNFKPHGSRGETVEFALKIPGADGSAVYLPVDAKFPLTRFEGLQQALAGQKADSITKARKALAKEIKTQAKNIAKYVNPPLTTDFAVMYLPLESLYAEVAQQTELVDELRRRHKIALAGPSTILPMLGMLSMGYRSLAIQKRVSEVWQILVETQEEFGKFGGLMEKAKKKIDEAGSVIEDAGAKTRTIEKKFKKVQRLEMDEKGKALE